MRPPQIIPVEELCKAALLFDAVGRWEHVDAFVVHGPPQALDKDVVVAAPAAIHADLDPVIPQHLGELVAGELRALIGIEDFGLAEPDEGLVQRLDAGPCRERVPSTWHQQIDAKRDGLSDAGDTHGYAAIATPVTLAQVAKAWV